jgi:CHAT domain-containing protein/Tfp pilus assembly protein PilF
MKNRTSVILLFLISALIPSALFAQSAGDYYNRAEEARERGEFEKAIEHFEKAGQLWLEEGWKQYYAAAQNDAGYLYFMLGKYEPALENFQRALEIHEELWNNAGAAGDLNNIGAVYYSWGKYDLAIEAFNRALSIHEELGDEAGAAVDVNNIGMVYLAWGKYDPALDHFQRALAMDEDLGRKAETAVRLNNIGQVYDAWGKYGKALEYYERALAIDEELGRQAEAAVRLNNIGGVYDSWEKYGKALEYFNRALAVHRELGDDAGAAVDLNNIGMVHYSLGKYESALEHFERALVIDKNLGRRAEAAVRLDNIGKVYYARQLYDQAADFFLRSIDIIEQVRLTASGEVRRDYLASQIDTYRFLISAEIRAGSPGGAFTAVEQSKARYLTEKIGEGFNLDELTFKTLGEIQGELPPDEAVAVFGNVNFSRPAVLCITREGLEALEIDTHRFIKEIETEYAADIAFTLEATRGLKISGQEEEGKDGEAAEGSFEDIAAYYRHLLSLGHPTSSEKKQREKLGRELYNLLIKPIERHLDGKTKLLIVPDGVLGFIPFETFIDSRGRYLAERYSIRYTQSLAVSDLISRRKYGAGKKPLLAFGGAVYEEIDGSGRGGTTEGRAGGESGPVVSRKEITYAISRGPEHMGDVYDRMGLRWANLPGTLEEVREIGPMFPGASVYTGRDVHEKVIKKLSARGELKQYDVLHFSTHGMVVPEYPELSALVLSQAGIAEGQAADAEDVADEDFAAAEDGYLCMPEIAALDIEAEFVNLSACETGLGKIYAGEGVVGLTQSFLIAGANGLSVSLWQVADESTKEFMVGMYRKVKDEGLSYAEAIREMKLEFLGGAPAGGAEKSGASHSGRYANPFYWAPFVYYGE